MSLPTPEYYRKELEELNTGYNISLQEVLKLMPEYKLANAISKISKKSNLYLSYSKNENKLKRTEQNIFNLKNSIEKDSYAVEESIKRMNKIIK